MKTVKGIARKTSESPRLLFTFLGATLLVLVVVLSAAYTETLADNLLIIAIVVWILIVVYFQLDHVVAVAERMEEQVTWRMPTSQNFAALTIDDVPLFDAPTQLEEILDVLKENDVKATFFIMSGFDVAPEKGGMKLEDRARCRSLLHRALSEGHELGNHMMFDAPAVAMPEEAFDEAFCHCDRLLAELFGGEEKWRSRPARWFRPASAVWSPHMLEMARRYGYSTVIGNCYPHDVASVTRFANAAYLRMRARPGSVIVVHDRWHTPATLRTALPLIKRRGMRLGTLSELHAAAASDPPRNETRAKRA